jgi:AraC family transcriptional regulator
LLRVSKREARESLSHEAFQRPNGRGGFKQGSPEQLAGGVGLGIVRFQDATSAFDDAAAAVLALDRSDLPILTALLYQGPLALEHLAVALVRPPRLVHAALGRLQLAGYARRVAGGEDERERFELTQLAGEWIEIIWGPMPREGARLLQSWSPREISKLASFLAQGSEILERRGARIRAHLEVPSSRLKNRLRGGLSPAALRRVQLFVEANLANPITLADLAERAGLSEHHFAHAFRASTETTPRVFVESRRIERAKHLLRESSLELAQIAIDTGFNTQSRFTTVFHRATGFTPAVYRRGGS